MDNQFSVLDILTIMSFMLQVQNLNENQEQTLALEEHLLEQDKQYNKIIELLERNTNG